MNRARSGATREDDFRPFGEALARHAEDGPLLLQAPEASHGCTRRDGEDVQPPRRITRHHHVSAERGGALSVETVLLWVRR